MDIFLQQILNGLVLGSMYALVALGYTMVYGIINLINFAHGEVLMVGALTSWTVITALAGAHRPTHQGLHLRDQGRGEFGALRQIRDGQTKAVPQLADLRAQLLLLRAVVGLPRPGVALLNRRGTWFCGHGVLSLQVVRFSPATTILLTDPGYKVVAISGTLCSLFAYGRLLGSNHIAY